MENATEISTGIVLGSLVLLAMASVIIVLVVYYQAKRVELEKNQQQKLLDSALRAEKKERERVSRDLHDGVSGHLNSVRNYITVLKRTTTGPGCEACDLALESVNQALDSVKEISQKLMPPMLKELGFFEATINMCKDLSYSGSFDAKFMIEGEDTEVNDKIAYQIFRIVQETYTNINKYAKASNVLLKLAYKEDKIKLEIIDDGSYFDFQEKLTKDPKQHGLKNILARVQLLNGKYTHSNQIPKGNKFTLTVKNDYYD